MFSDTEEGFLGIYESHLTSYAQKCMQQSNAYILVSLVVFPPFLQQRVLHFHFISTLANCVAIPSPVHFTEALLATGRHQKSMVLDEISKPKDTH